MECLPHQLGVIAVLNDGIAMKMEINGMSATPTRSNCSPDDT